jgi:hypothetical protein
MVEASIRGEVVAFLMRRVRVAVENLSEEGEMRRMTGVVGVAGVIALVMGSAASAQTAGVSASSSAPKRVAPRAAQGSSDVSGFGMGYTDIGPVLGLGGIGDAGISLGGRFEHAIKDLPDMGKGILGLMVGVDWYSYDLGAFGSISYIPIGVTANYHFHMDNKKFDPFVGLGLGYYIVSAPDCGIYDCGYNSGIYFIGRAGARYFLSEKMALYGDVGSGAGALHVGVTFKMAGGK